MAGWLGGQEKSLDVKSQLNQHKPKIWTWWPTWGWTLSTGQGGQHGGRHGGRHGGGHNFDQF